MLDPPTLRAWRTARGLSRTEAAALLGISARTLETLEYGRKASSALWGPLARVIALLDAHARPAAE
jgi:transcriptional regulator with XRE-family HTH domain